MSTARVQVVVIGAGPAGAATARALATLGHEVVLLHDDRAAHVPAVESLPPSARAVVGQLGLADLVAEASVARMLGNTVCWAGARAADTLLPEPGDQVARPVLDRLLRFAAETAGVVVHAGVRAVEVVEEPAGVRVRTRSGRREAWMSADVAVVAVGRGTLRTGARRTGVRGWRTLALCGDWARVAGLPAPRDATTWIESGPDGWAWAVPLGAGRRQVTIMIDPPAPGTRPRALEKLYRERLAASPQIAATVREGALEGVRATDASASIVSPVATRRVVRVGDACGTVDPIASFGIKKALTSARLAAALVNTRLRRPSSIADIAIAQYAQAEARELAGSMAGAAEEAARALRAHGGAFWARRKFRAAQEREPQPTASLDAPPVRLPTAALRLAGDARLEPRVVLEGWLFEERLALVSPHWPAGLRFLGGVDVAAAIRAVESSGDPTTRAERYERLAGRPAGTEALQAALGRLVALGVLSSA